MKNRDVRRAFGSPDEGFTRRIDETLGRLLKEEEKPVKKLRMGVAVAIAACLLLAAVAFAAVNRWGLMDFVHNVADVSILPEATDLVATGIPQEGGDTEYATFSLREAVYDGEYAYMLFDVKPKEGVLLLGVDSDPEYSMQDLTGEESDMTIGEYAEANGLKMVLTNIGTGFREASLDFHMEADGTLVYGIRGPAPKAIGEALAMSVRCITYPVDYEDFDRDAREALLLFTLVNENAAVLGENASTADFPSCGVRVDAVRLQATPMGLYYKIHYTVIDQAALDAVEDGLWFEFLGKDGERMAGGATAGGSVTEDGSGGYIQSDSVAAVKKIPASVTLRAYSAWTKDRYETAEIAITPVQ